MRIPWVTSLQNIIVANNNDNNKNNSRNGSFFNVAGYLIEERRRWPVITLPHEDNVLNKFRILKERHVQMRKPYQSPYQSPGRMKNSSHYIAPAGDRTHDLPYTVASNNTSRPAEDIMCTFFKLHIHLKKTYKETRKSM